MDKKITAFLSAGSVLLAHLLATPSADAAEGAASHYLPGVAGDLALAVPPDPGLQFANITFYQNGNVGRAVLNGRVETSLDLDLVLNIPSLFYNFDTRVLGGTATVGIAVPFGHARLKASLTGPGGGTISAKRSDFDISDIAVTPLALTWNHGNFSYKVAHVVTAPTGGYDTDKTVNLGRNYWSFDTIGAMTWLNPKTGTEFSIAPGLMFNTKNKDTNYRTGAEFHVDTVANQFVAKNLAIGLRGYYYKQISRDSGSGARLGDFKSESLGLGGGIFWTPAATDGKLVVAARYMTDVHSKNRFDSDYGQLTLAWKF